MSRVLSIPLSVVVPTMGRATLIRTLESLLASHAGAEIDIIAVGKISDAAVAGRVEQLLTAHANLRHLPVAFATGDSSQKKNAGAAEAKGTVIAFVDDDVVVAADWPQQICAAFADDAVGLVSGPGLIPEDINEVGRQAGLALSSRGAGYVAERYRQNAGEPYAIDWDRVIGCNAAYRREAFAQMGGFPADFYPGEEMIAAFWTEQKGWKLLFLPQARVWHYPRQSCRRFWRQVWGYGATRIRLLRRGVTFNALPLVPGIWVAVTLLLLLLSPFSIWAFRLLLLDLVSYLAVNWLAALEIIYRTKRPGNWRVLFMILLMHTAYGLAEWRELLFPNRDFGAHD